jgi:hypothetical protein
MWNNTTYYYTKRVTSRAEGLDHFYEAMLRVDYLKLPRKCENLGDKDKRNLPRFRKEYFFRIIGIENLERIFSSCNSEDEIEKFAIIKTQDIIDEALYEIFYYATTDYPCQKVIINKDVTDEFKIFYSQKWLKECVDYIVTEWRQFKLEEILCGADTRLKYSEVEAEFDPANLLEELNIAILKSIYFAIDRDGQKGNFKVEYSFTPIMMDNMLKRAHEFSSDEVFAKFLTAWYIKYVVHELFREAREYSNIPCMADYCEGRFETTSLDRLASCGPLRPKERSYFIQFGKYIYRNWYDDLYEKMVLDVKKYLDIERRYQAYGLDGIL